MFVGRGSCAEKAPSYVGHSLARTRSRTHALAHSLAHSRTHALAHSLTRSRTPGNDSGVSAMGGVCYFNVSVDEPAGDMDLLQHLLDGSNVKVDEAAEERKGGADDLGKAFLSAGETQLAIIFHVPKELAERKGVSMQEWMDALLAPVKGKGMQVVEQTEEVAKVIVPANPDGDAFPLKMRDECTGCGFAFLRERGLIPADDSSDDDVNYADAAGVEW